jgi:hypothetical protein
MLLCASAEGGRFAKFLCVRAAMGRLYLVLRHAQWAMAETPEQTQRSLSDLVVIFVPNSTNLLIASAREGMSL